MSIGVQQSSNPDAHRSLMLPITMLPLGVRGGGRDRSARSLLASLVPFLGIISGRSTSYTHHVPVHSALWHGKDSELHTVGEKFYWSFRFPLRVALSVPLILPPEPTRNRV